MNELLIQNEMKKAKAETNREQTVQLIQQKKLVQNQKKQQLIDRKNNNQFQKLVHNLQQF